MRRPLHPLPLPSHLVPRARGGEDTLAEDGLVPAVLGVQAMDHHVQEVHRGLRGPGSHEEDGNLPQGLMSARNTGENMVIKLNPDTTPAFTTTLAKPALPDVSPGGLGGRPFPRPT